MTIDEAITLERQIAKDQIDRICTFEHEQIANWLEELKVLKEYKENSVSKEAFEKMKSRAYKKGHRQGYAKAIDDFSEKAINIVYEENNIDMNQQTRDMNQQTRDMVVDIHCKLMDLAKLLKKQNK